MLKRYVFAALALAASTAPAFAHLDPAHHGSFIAGLSHPLFGVDHVQHAHWPNFDQTAGKAWFLHQAEHVQRIVVFGQSARDKPIVTGIVHRRIE